MSEYEDLQKIAALQAEQLQIDQALTILDEHGGTVSTYTVAATTPAATMPGVQIMTVDPGQSLISGVRSSLIQRYNAINKELRDLGVTGGPPDHAGGPHTETSPPAA